MIEQALDFREEADALARLIEARSEQDWKRKTQFKGWTINDVIAHLHFADYAADLSLRDGVAFKDFVRDFNKPNLCNEAALTAARYNHSEISIADFEEALDKVRLGAALPHLIDPVERRIVAYHESGHAMVAWLTPAADPVHKVTIVPHGHALGLTEQLPRLERHNYSESYLRTRLAVMLGGRTAEEIAIGEVTTGAENDLIEATRLARRMVTRWGMGKLGLVAFKTDEQQPFLGYEISQGREYSEATAAAIDQEVRALIEETHKEVRQRLKDARERLDQLATALLQEETIGSDELARILGPRPQPIPETDGHGATSAGDELAHKPRIERV